MTLPGGAADKIGNRYELRWTVQAFAQLLRGELDLIRLENPGEDCCEFYTASGTTRTYHQVKWQVGAGKWSLALLKKKKGKKQGVLEYFWTKLNEDSDSQCNFVSTCDAPDIRELAERSGQATNHSRICLGASSRSSTRTPSTSQLKKISARSPAGRGLRR